MATAYIHRPIRIFLEAIVVGVDADDGRLADECVRRHSQVIRVAAILPLPFVGHVRPDAELRWRRNDGTEHRALWVGFGRRGVSRGSPPLTLSANGLYVGQVVNRAAAKLPH
jgi:hypothetical protein